MARKPELYYGEYLGLEKLLSCQNLKSVETGSPMHDEMLFIIMHQAYELWFKQTLHELSSVIHIFNGTSVNEKRIGIAVSRLLRITEIQKLLIQQLHVLETMTPLDFLDFRNDLIPASGFQSFQFRMIEAKLGLQRAAAGTIQFNYLDRLSKEHQDLVKKVEKEPSLFQCIEKWLERTPFLELESFSFLRNYRKSVEKMLSRDEKTILNNTNLSKKERNDQVRTFAMTKEHFDAIFDSKKHENMVKQGHRRLSYKATLAALFIHLYRDEPILHLPFRLLTALVDIDELLTTWRYQHALMAHRMIGSKIGTGGTSGFAYLKTVAEKHKIFSDYTNLSTFLIPRSDIPKLPPQIDKELGFSWM